MRGFFSKKTPAPAPSSEDQRSALFGDHKASPAPPSGKPPGNPYRAPRDNSYGPSGAGPGMSRNDDPNRGQLFAGAGQRQQQSYTTSNQGTYGMSDGLSGQQGGYGQQSNPDRHLTEAEEEEEDVEAVKQQIRFTKQESVASSRNALRIAAQAEETGRNTLVRLGAQGERLHNTEKNLDLASNHSRVAEQKAKELKVANGSMFAIHMKNPLRSTSRAQQEEANILARHQADREEREKTREFGFESRNGVGKALGGNCGYNKLSNKMSLAERSKYQFEGDESDDEKEKEIENNLDALGAVTGRLKNLAMATSQEVDRQNAQIDKIMKKSDKVDDQIAITHNRIRKIH